MDRNSVIGLLLIAGILIGYSILTTPSKEELRQERLSEEKAAQEEQEKSQEKRAQGEKKAEAEKEKDNSEAEPKKGSPDKEELRSDQVTEERTDSTVKDSSQLEQEYGIFAPAASAKEAETYTIENERLKIELSEKGGRIISVVLKDYQTYDSSELYLFERDSSDYGLSFFFERRRLKTNELHFKALGESFKVNGEERDSIIFRTPTTEEGTYIEFVYKMKGESFQVDHEVRMKGLGNRVENDVALNWSYKNPSTEKDMFGQRRISTICYQYLGGDQSYLTQQGKGSAELVASTEWLSFKQKFFSSILISDRGFGNYNANIQVEDLNSSRYVSQYQAKVNLPFKNTDQGRFPMTFFFGPNDYHLLASHDRNFEDTMNLGWGIIGWINEYLIIPIFGLLDGSGLSYGIVILILTLIIKTLLFPLTYKSFLSGAKQRVLKPEIDAIQEKYKDSQDQMKQQQEMMALYKKSGVNPMAGCLPMFIQLPILIAMYRFFPASIELRQESFLWANDLSTFDSVLSLPFHIPFYGDHVSLFTLLMFGSTLLYTKMSSSQMGGGGGQQMPQMKVMMYIFPVFILFIFNSWPAGLSYYYFAANVISIFQMLIVKHWIIDEEALKQKIEENKKKPQKEKKPSKFQKRLEEMSKQQEAQKGRKKK